MHPFYDREYPHRSRFTSQVFIPCVTSLRARRGCTVVAMWRSSNEYIDYKWTQSCNISHCCCRPYCSFHITTAASEALDPKILKTEFIFFKYTVEVGVARPQTGPWQPECGKGNPRRPPRHVLHPELLRQWPDLLEVRPLSQKLGTRAKTSWSGA